MASVSGGYDNKFLDTPPDDYTCLICHSVCRDPQQLKCCAKLYCQTCLEDYRKTKHTCPTCRKRMVTFEDKLSHRRIKALKVSCDNESAGCTWTGELGSLEEHTTMCNIAEISCTNKCSTKVLRGNLESHLTNDCPRRKHKCPHCDEEGEYRNMTTAHLAECPQVVVTCPNAGCGIRKKRFKISSHRDSCPKEVVKCSYAKVGCEETMMRENCQEHQATGVECHLQLTVERIAILENKVKEPIVPVVLKISDFSKFNDKNGDWYSKKFYSHPGGYRMTLKAYANGDKEEDRSHLSVYICLTGGEYDDILVWPFHGTVTIDLLNQLEDSNHQTMSLPINVTKTTNAKRPPKGGRNNGYGWGKFMSHKQLEYTPSTNCQYLKDNCLYFRISKVDLDPANKLRPWLAL